MGLNSGSVRDELAQKFEGRRTAAWDPLSSSFTLLDMLDALADSVDGPSFRGSPIQEWAVSYKEKRYVVIK